MGIVCGAPLGAAHAQSPDVRSVRKPNRVSDGDRVWCAARGCPRPVTGRSLCQEAQSRKRWGSCVVRRSGLPMPSRRTFATGIVPFAHCMPAALRHPGFACRQARLPGMGSPELRVSSSVFRKPTGRKAAGCSCWGRGWFWPRPTPYGVGLGRRSHETHASWVLRPGIRARPGRSNHLRPWPVCSSPRTRVAPVRWPGRHPRSERAVAGRA